MARLTLLLTLLALVLPAAAPAATPEEASLATERYYQSYRAEPAVTAAPAVPAAGNDGPSWLGAAAIGAGLALLAGGLGAYAARTVRPRGIGA